MSISNPLSTLVAATPETDSISTTSVRLLPAESDASQPGFSVASPSGYIVRAEFLDAPRERQAVAEGEGAVAFWAKQSVRGVAFAHERRVQFALSRTSLSPIVVRVRFHGLTGITGHGQTLSGRAGSDRLGISIFDGQVVDVVEDSTLLFLMSGPQMRVEIHADPVAEGIVGAKSSSLPASDGAIAHSAPFFGAMDVRYYVPAGANPPEFSLGVFDEDPSSLTVLPRARPLWQGVPILSTVPAQGGGEDDVALGVGVGALMRTVWLRVIPSDVLENLTAGQTSALLGLNYLPPGTSADAAESIPLVYQGMVDGLPLYTGQIVVFRADAGRGPDGLGHLAVYLPTTQDLSLPFTFDVGTGAGTGFDDASVHQYDTPGEMAPYGTVQAQSLPIAKQGDVAMQTVESSVNDVLSPGNPSGVVKVPRPEDEAVLKMLQNRGPLLSDRAHRGMEEYVRSVTELPAVPAELPSSASVPAPRKRKQTQKGGNA